MRFEINGMTSRLHVRVATMDEDLHVERLLSLPDEDSPEAWTFDARRAIVAAREWLLAEQQPDGHWVAELEGDTILESEYILLLAFLGERDSLLAKKCARQMLGKQLHRGGWAIYPGGPIEISASVKAYFALKLTGHDPSQDDMQRAREAILAAGGADAVNSFTRFYLALLGQIPYEQCPAVPPEMLLLPKWFPVSLYGVSAWSRTMIVPLSIMWAMRPKTDVPTSLGIRELFLKNPAEWSPPVSPGAKSTRGIFSWDNFFRRLDRVVKWCERRRLRPLRAKALSLAERWMSRRLFKSDGLGAIFPPMVWSIIAYKALGHGDESPELSFCRAQLDRLVIEEEETARLQPCKSPVWDTAITLRALAESGVPLGQAPARQGVEWLLDREVTSPGDWAETVKAAPGGWCFEYANEFYPDVDDTAMATMALAELFDERRDADMQRERGEGRGTSLAGLDSAAGAIERAERWMLAMQNKDGGWGAFDRDNDRPFLCRVPFADHNAMIDPSTPDLTARVLESLGRLGRRLGDPAVDRGIAYLRKTQEPDGSWFGRWGVNYIYGTWQGLTGLSAVGVPTSDPAIQAGANWLMAWQQSSGGWGESPDSYTDPRRRGQGPVTASQTAWAILGLLAAGRRETPAVARGIRFLLDRQQSDGTWDEREFTGTGFPEVFYLRYHYYRIYFPLMALSRSVGSSPRFDRPVDHATRFAAAQEAG